MTKLDNSIFKKSISSAHNEAGARYTPALDHYKDFPSIQINYLIDAFDGLGRNNAYRKRWEEASSDLKEAKESSLFLREHWWRHYPEVVRRSKESSKRLQRFMVAVKKLCKSSCCITGKLQFKQVLEIQRQLMKSLDAATSCLRELGSQKKEKPQGESGEHVASIDDLLHAIRKLEDSIYAIRRHCESLSTKLFNDQSALLLGMQGSGKTHFLCDYAEQRENQGSPTLIFLAQNLSLAQNDIWKGIISKLHLHCSKTEFIKFLEKKARAQKTRALIVIDGINESFQKRRWNAILKKVQNDLKRHSRIAFIFSCRTPYERMLLSGRTRKSVPEVWHDGFTSQELEAQESFFTYYRIPPPEVPLLTPEFTNPLFLKIFCESLRDATVKQKHKQIFDISSGQKGMTNLFEDFVNRKQIDVVDRLKKDLKGRNVFNQKDKWIWNGLLKSMAKIMVSNRCDYLLHSEFHVELNRYLTDPKFTEKAKFALVNESILIEGLEWDKDRKPFEVIKFSYQKLSDHLIARTLMSKLKYTKKVFSGLFDDWKNHPSILDAIMIELPLRKSGVELFKYSKKEPPDYLIRAFIAGLYWRDKKAFNTYTTRYISVLLRGKSYANDLLEVLTVLACKPEHPFNALRLSRYLERFSLTDRDLFWSEFIRSSETSSAVFKIVRWISKRREAPFDEKFAYSYLKILSWLLTTTIRKFRDEVTQAIYLIGVGHPSILFKIMQESFKINDPYIRERVLAALYGVAMQAASNPKSRTVSFRKDLRSWATWMVNNVLRGSGKYFTLNIRIRDYAVGTLELALFHGLVPNKYSRFIHMPKRFPRKIKAGSLWRHDAACVKKLKDTSKSSLEFGYRDYVHMDSAKYILGSISNVDDHTSILAESIAATVWKLKTLGWSKKKFKDLDNELSRANFYREASRESPGKIDRYGKKYFWISYYELSGFHLTKYESGGYYSWWSPHSEPLRERDVDPSYPDCSRDAHITDDFLSQKARNVKEWMVKTPPPSFAKHLMPKSPLGINGEWVLIDGYFSQDDKLKDRQLFAFLKGLIFTKTQRERFYKFASLIDYPGNELIPRNPNSEQVFAGEIPWSRFFKPNGSHEIKIPTGKKKQRRVRMHRPRKKLRIVLPNADGTEQEISFDGFNDQVYAVPITENIKVELPVTSVSFPGEIQAIKGLSVISRNICDRMNLSFDPSKAEFLDSSGKKAGFIVHGGDQYRTGQHLTYMRRDIFDRYLGKNKKFVWYIWGERRSSFGGQTDHEFRDVFQSHAHIHKQIIDYPSKKKIDSK